MKTDNLTELKKYLSKINKLEDKQTRQGKFSDRVEFLLKSNCCDKTPQDWITAILQVLDERKV